jgi:hypothetical protein
MTLNFLVGYILFTVEKLIKLNKSLLIFIQKLILFFKNNVILSSNVHMYHLSVPVGNPFQEHRIKIQRRDSNHN